MALRILSCYDSKNTPAFLLLYLVGFPSLLLYSASCWHCCVELEGTGRLSHLVSVSGEAHDSVLELVLSKEFKDFFK